MDLWARSAEPEGEGLATAVTALSRVGAGTTWEKWYLWYAYHF